jgi:diaminopimelate epimerase
LTIHFYKYQGTGNDFIMIDDREGTFPIENNTLVAHLCDRRFGIGADGLILLQKSPDADFYMKYYNSDGNESSMCGNGGRCLAAFAHYLDIVKEKTTFIAVDGLHDAIISGNGNALFIKLKMQNVSTIEARNPNTFVLNTGSPHFVQFIQKNMDELSIIEEARAIRYNHEFKQHGINVNFVNVINSTAISMRTYERGVEDETLSCGTGVTAAALSTAVLNNLPSGTHTIEVKVKGGELNVNFMYDKITGTFKEVWLEGPTNLVYEGKMAV